MILRGILDELDYPPVIIIQGDHGAAITSDRGRMSILNAYYLPEDWHRALYPTITPVNSFRVVFNAFFGGNMRCCRMSATSRFTMIRTTSVVIPPTEGCGGQ